MMLDFEDEKICINCDFAQDVRCFGGAFGLRCREYVLFVDDFDAGCLKFRKKVWKFGKKKPETIKLQNCPSWVMENCVTCGISEDNITISFS